MWGYLRLLPIIWWCLKNFNKQVCIEIWIFAVWRYPLVIIGKLVYCYQFSIETVTSSFVLISHISNPFICLRHVIIRITSRVQLGGWKENVIESIESFEMLQNDNLIGVSDEMSWLQKSCLTALCGLSGDNCKHYVAHFVHFVMWVMSYNLDST